MNSALYKTFYFWTAKVWFWLYSSLHLFTGPCWAKSRGRQAHPRALHTNQQLGMLLYSLLCLPRPVEITFFVHFSDSFCWKSLLLLLLWNLRSRNTALTTFDQDSTLQLWQLPCDFKKKTSLGLVKRVVLFKPHFHQRIILCNEKKGKWRI